jgi:hypothetical protein
MKNLTGWKKLKRRTFKELEVAEVNILRG